MNASSMPICFKIKFYEDWVCRFFVLSTGHRNSLEKSLRKAYYYLEIKFYNFVFKFNLGIKARKVQEKLRKLVFTFQPHLQSTVIKIASPQYHIG